MVIKCPNTFMFGSAGFGGGYYIGVYKAMVERWGYTELQQKLYYGMSSGSVMSLYILLGYTWEDLDNEFIIVSKLAKRYGIFMKASYYHDKLLKRFVYKDAYKKVSGKLFVGVTNFHGKFVIISQWKSNRDLIDTIHASMHIPYYSGRYINRLNNKRCIDGGCSIQNYDFLEEKTLKIGVWATNIYDIKLTPSLTFKNSAKPNILYYHKIKQQGYTQLLNWSGDYINNNVYKSNKNNIKLYIFWLFRASEDIVYKII